MEWKFCNNKGEISQIPTSFQIDTVGNILQKSGAIKPKACQKCEIIFKTETKQIPKKQKVSLYKCTECDFENANGDAAFDHTILSEHKLTKKTEERIIGFENILEGEKSHVVKTDEDCIITCQKCKP